MSRNSSSSSANVSGQCQVASANLAIFTSFFISYGLLLPLFVFVLWQLSRRHCRSAAVETRDSDVFTLQMVLLQIVGVMAISVYCYGIFSGRALAIQVGYNLYSSLAPGETMLHVLTCVERYLAVVHPVTYRRLTQSGGVRIRNASISCVWLLCAGITCASISSYASIVLTFLLLVLASTGVTYCSVSVLLVLIRPRPGEAGGVRERADRAKHKAFYTIAVIMATLLVRFLSYLVYSLLYMVLQVKAGDQCLFFWSSNWFSMPSVLVLPLLFLQRLGKLPMCGQSCAG